MCTENLIRVALAAVLALASARCHRRLPLARSVVMGSDAVSAFADEPAAVEQRSCWRVRSNVVSPLSSLMLMKPSVD